VVCGVWCEVCGVFTQNVPPQLCFAYALGFIKTFNESLDSLVSAVK
jgi:hypothetical protein